MRLDEVLRILGQHGAEIASYGVTSLHIFGSVARGEAGPESDVDVLVEFGVPVGLFELVRFQRFLEKLLGQRVDLATVGALRENMREQILREAVRAA
ncbi:MAG: nucleotidyltransferase family protein [Chloroflexi bacterium]|nr:nucleotidyltransferase family protein [Chloroflexota bacterium]